MYNLFVNGWKWDLDRLEICHASEVDENSDIKCYIIVSDRKTFSRVMENNSGLQFHTVFIIAHITTYSISPKMVSIPSSILSENTAEYFS